MNASKKTWLDVGRECLLEFSCNRFEGTAAPCANLGAHHEASSFRKLQLRQNSSFTHCDSVIRVPGETNTRRLQYVNPMIWNHHFQPSLSGSSDLSKRNANVKQLRRNSSSEETSESIKSSTSSQVEDTRCRNSRLSCGTHCLAWR